MFFRRLDLFDASVCRGWGLGPVLIHLTKCECPESCGIYLSERKKKAYVGGFWSDIETLKSERAVVILPGLEKSLLAGDGLLLMSLKVQSEMAIGPRTYAWILHGF